MFLKVNVPKGIHVPKGHYFLTKSQPAPMLNRKYGINKLGDDLYNVFCTKYICRNTIKYSYFITVMFYVGQLVVILQLVHSHVSGITDTY